MRRIFTILLCVATCLLSVGRATASAEGQERPRKVILFIGDGMSLAHWQTGMVMNRAPLNVNRMERIGVVQTCSLTDFNGDGPSHGTAIACGVKSRKGAVGIDATGKPAKSILAYASEQGMATGIVSANTLQEGSLSPFVAHVGSRMRVDSISAAYLEQGVDLFIGAGYGSFKDNEVNPDLLEDLRKAGYQVVLSMEAIRQAGEGKLAGFTTDGKVADIRSGRGDQFPASVRVALERLGKDPEGFLLVVGDMFVDRASHAGDVELVGQEVIDLDKAIGEALDFAEKDGNTLVVVVGGPEASGMTLVGGDLSAGRVEAKWTMPGMIHTGTMIPLFAYGAGSDVFQGFMENTDLFVKIKSWLMDTGSKE